MQQAAARLAVGGDECLAQRGRAELHRGLILGGIAALNLLLQEGRAGQVGGWVGGGAGQGRAVVASLAVWVGNAAADEASPRLELPRVPLHLPVLRPDLLLDVVCHRGVGADAKLFHFGNEVALGEARRRLRVALQAGLVLRQLIGLAAAW